MAQPTLDARQTKHNVIPPGARRSTLNVNSVHGGVAEVRPRPTPVCCCLLLLGRSAIGNRAPSQDRSEPTDRARLNRPTHSSKLQVETDRRSISCVHAHACETHLWCMCSRWKPFNVVSASQHSTQPCVCSLARTFEPFQVSGDYPFVLPAPLVADRAKAIIDRRCCSPVQCLVQHRSIVWYVSIYH